MLPEDKRKQLDEIVQKMLANEEDDETIKFVVEDFKKKYTTAQDTPQQKGIIDTVLDNPLTRGIQSFFPGKQVGETLGTIGGLGVEKIKETLGFSPKGSTKAYREYGLNAPSPLQVGGDIAQGAAMVAGLKVPIPTSILGAAGQYGALSGIQGAGSALAEGKDIGKATKEGLISGAIGAGAGAVFNLLGKGISALAKKTAPSALSFTSGVPRGAIEQTIKSPEIAKEGLKISVPQVRERAVSSLQTLYKDLGDEFSQGLDEIVSQTGQTKKGVVYGQKGFLGGAEKIQNKLTEYARSFAREFRLSTKAGAEGVEIGFSKSPIVKAGEQKAVQEAFSTISTWDDFSAKGMQDLAERIGALRNFESGVKTESSAIVGKIYHKIAQGIIPDTFPELAQLRTNFSVNKKVLDEIGNVISIGKDKPTQIQASVSRLDNLFKENRDEYINAIRELANRSGVDFVSLLAGGEFQKLLPNFIRGLGGGAAVSVGASLINPWLVLLSPLFSPRAVGAITRNAPSVAKTISPLIRSVATQIIPQVNKQ